MLLIIRMAMLAVATIIIRLAKIITLFALVIVTQARVEVLATVLLSVLALILHAHRNYFHDLTKCNGAAFQICVSQPSKLPSVRFVPRQTNTMTSVIISITIIIIALSEHTR